MNHGKGILINDPTILGTPLKQRRTRLLLIGINDYENLQKLEYPVSDCNDFFTLLKDHYGFRQEDIIRKLFNQDAVAGIIFDELYNLNRVDENNTPRLTSNDNLIIYFSGHGYFDSIIDEGFWIPVTAHVPRNDHPSDLLEFISLSAVIQCLSKLKAHHIILIVDSCFAGKFIENEIEVPSGGDPNDPEEKPSRWVLTSGRLEPVLDKSPFSKELIKVLSENPEKRISINRIGAEVMHRVGKSDIQKPWCGTLGPNKFDGGEYFFYRQTEINRDEMKVPEILRCQVSFDELIIGTKEHLDRLKKGRFKLLRIEQILLTSTSLPEFIDTETKSGELETSLLQALHSIWQTETPHAILLAEGGMGKTVSLIRLWDDLLGKDQNSIIPLFVALNEYNTVSDEEKYDFILRSISRNCGVAEVLTEGVKNILWNLLQTTQDDGSPKVMLLLDGFNEITVTKDQLLIELNRLNEMAKGTQVILTSRYIETQSFSWARHSTIVKLIPLTHGKIKAFMQQVNFAIPTDVSVMQLLSNPMMLTLYVGSNSIAKQYKDDNRFHFLSVASYGELLWNFNEALLAKHFENNEHDNNEQIYYTFLLHILVPWLAYRMEKEGQYFIPTRMLLNPTFNFKTLLDEAFTKMNEMDLVEAFPEFEGKRTMLGLGYLDDMDAREQRSLKVRQYLVEKLHILVVENELLRFVHQNFRDYFAAFHLRNVAKIALSQNIIPIEWKERTWPIYLRRLLGEIEGEHYVKPIFDGKEFSKSKPGNVISKVLDLCRIEMSPSTNVKNYVGFSIWNIIKIYLEKRGNLIGVDFSYLYLFDISLNGIYFSAHRGVHYLPAIFKGALVDSNQIFFKYHSGTINIAIYSNDNNKILTASTDGTVKEWSVNTGQCLQTYHLGSQVLKANYNIEGNKILTVTDFSVKEWSVKTGQSLEETRDIFGTINSAVYSKDGKKVLIISTKRDYFMSVNDDGEWVHGSSEPKTMLETFSIETSKKQNSCNVPITKFKYIVCSCDGKKILITSEDGTVKEWSVESGEFIQSYLGHNETVLSAVYANNEKNVVTILKDGTFKEWSVETAECLQTFTGHRGPVGSVVYSLDGKKILTSGFDKMVKEWSVETGECLQTFSGHGNSVVSAVYSNDSKKILTSGFDIMVKEWSVETGECLQTISGPFTLIESELESLEGRKASLESVNDNLIENASWIYPSLDSVRSAKYSPDGKKVLIIPGEYAVKEWLVETGQCLHSFIHNARVEIAGYSKDGKKVLTTSLDNLLQEWSVESGTCLKVFKGHNGIIKSAIYSDDGERILTASYDTTVKEWSTESGKCLQTYSHYECVKSAVYNYDEEKILSFSSNKMVKIWSVNSGQCLLTLSSPGHFEKNAVYSRDKKKVLSFSSDTTFSEWSTETGKCLQEFKGHLAGINSAVYNREGTKILTTSNDSNVKEWSVNTGKCLQTFSGHSTQVQGAIYNHDESNILSYGVSVKLWSVESGKCMRTFRQLNEVSNAVYSIDGKKILVISSGKTVQEWSVETGECLRTYQNSIGLNVQGCDFRKIHPECYFTEEEKERLRDFGAIFNDDDAQLWKDTIEDAYSDDSKSNASK